VTGLNSALIFHGFKYNSKTHYLNVGQCGYSATQVTNTTLNLFWFHTNINLSIHYNVLNSIVHTQFKSVHIIKIQSHLYNITDTMFSINFENNIIIQIKNTKLTGWLCINRQYFLNKTNEWPWIITFSPNV